MLSFTKMQGTGNDYVYMDTFTREIENPAALSVRVSDRHFGIGSDGLILVKPCGRADFEMEMYNADGSRAEMCGNGIRCAAKYAWEKGLIPAGKTELTVLTGAGILSVSLHLKAGKVESATVDMGRPILEPEKIPVLASGTGPAPVLTETVKGQPFELTCISMGNPHAVTFLPAVDDFDVAGVGSLLEVAPVFPRKANIEFVQVIDREHLKMRVWERGSGETLSCGTGSCAAAVAAALKGLTARAVTMQVLGGELQIRWDETDDHVYLTGPAVTVFSGQWEE